MRIPHDGGSSIDGCFSRAATRDGTNTIYMRLREPGKEVNSPREDGGVSLPALEVLVAVVQGRASLL